MLSTKGYPVERREGLPGLRVIDLTKPLGPGTRVYPGDPPVVAETYAVHGRDGYYARRLCLPEHGGTHVDAPIHFDPRGLDVASIPAWRLVAPALVISIDSDHSSARNISGALDSCGSGPLRGWLLLVKGYAMLDESAARLLLGLGIGGLGVETMSPDEEPYPVHRILLSHGIMILENLDLSALTPCTRLTVFIGALKLLGGSGAPARVIGLLDDASLGLEVLGEHTSWAHE